MRGAARFNLNWVTNVLDLAANTTQSAQRKLLNLQLPVLNDNLFLACHLNGSDADDLDLSRATANSQLRGTVIDRVVGS